MTFAERIASSMGKTISDSREISPAQFCAARCPLCGFPIGRGAQANGPSSVEFLSNFVLNPLRDADAISIDSDFDSTKPISAAIKFMPERVDHQSSRRSLGIRTERTIAFTILLLP